MICPIGTDLTVPGVSRTVRLERLREENLSVFCWFQTFFYCKDLHLPIAFWKGKKLRVEFFGRGVGSA